MAKDKAVSDTAPSGAWKAPETAKALDLAEFVEWNTVNDVLICKFTADVRRRPDETNPNKTMTSVIVSPAIMIPGGDTAKAQVYQSLALGISAHLGLLISDPTTRAGDCFAIEFAGHRPPQVRGQKPSRQFNVYELNGKAFDAELAKFAGDNHPF